MTKFILLLAAVFSLSVIAQAADPTPAASPSAKSKSKSAPAASPSAKSKSKSAPAASPSPKAKSKSNTTQHHKVRQQHQMTGS
jgi:hypothetical protein